MSVSAGRKVFSVTGVATLPIADQAAGGLDNGLMDRFEEVLRLEKIRNPVERVVVDQNRAQQALFRLDIVRRAPIGRSSRVGRELEDVRISQGHGFRLCFVFGLLILGFSDAGGDKAPLAGAAKAEAALCTDSPQ